MAAKKITPKGTKVTKPSERGVKQVVNTYFKLIRDLRAGDKNSVPRLMELWDQDGTFEFAGAPPVVGTFRGAMAINTLYKNRLEAKGMRLSVETNRAKPRDVTLGVVDTNITHMKINGNRVAVGWRTTIGTEENHGFDVAGSHFFTFEDGKIKSLRVTVSPKPDQSQLESLRLTDLTINDVGRLSLAAWPVV